MNELILLCSLTLSLLLYVRVHIHPMRHCQPWMFYRLQIICFFDAILFCKIVLSLIYFLIYNSHWRDFISVFWKKRTLRFNQRLWVHIGKNFLQLIYHRLISRITENFSRRFVFSKTKSDIIPNIIWKLLFQFCERHNKLKNNIVLITVSCCRKIFACFDSRPLGNLFQTCTLTLYHFIVITSW